MNHLFVSGIIITILLVTTSSYCPSPSEVISSSFLNNIFNVSFSSVRSQNQLNNLIQNPSSQ